MKNVLGTDLKLCSKDPVTGYFRDGFCRTNNQDKGRHVIASVMTDEFLTFSKSKGNDLTTPNTLYNFPGLKSGDKWCVCALRWKEAFVAGSAPRVDLEATHERALDYVSINDLLKMSSLNQKEQS
jgi:uncharacterized protein (DUF2237 family)